MYKLLLCVVALGMIGCSGATGLTIPPPQYDAGFVGCVNDLSCADHGTACGTDVCSWADPYVHVCVPAASGDMGWCGDDPFLLANGQALPQDQADRTCKCFVQGATCDITTNFCSFTHQ